MLCIVGSVGLDTIETVTEKRVDVLGGSAVYASYAASLFAPVMLISAVGEDFPARFRQLLASRNINRDNLATLPGKTFRWHGRYGNDMNRRETLSISRNVIAEFKPQPLQLAQTDYLFLANAKPELQLAALSAISGAGLVFADTKLEWITEHRAEFEQVLASTDGLIINIEEALALTGEQNPVRAAHAATQYGPRIVIIKQGDNGAILFHGRELTALPAFPIPEVVDPTGAGDSLAGAFLGYIAKTGRTDRQNLKKALAVAIIAASFCCEDFSLDRLVTISIRDIEGRLAQFKDMLSW